MNKITGYLDRVVIEETTTLLYCSTHLEAVDLPQVGTDVGLKLTRLGVGIPATLKRVEIGYRTLFVLSTTSFKKIEHSNAYYRGEVEMICPIVKGG